MTPEQFYQSIREANEQTAELTRQNGIGWRKLMLAKPHLVTRTTRNKLNLDLRNMERAGPAGG